MDAADHIEIFPKIIFSYLVKWAIDWPLTNEVNYEGLEMNCRI
jgi:hypothetical protein